MEKLLLTLLFMVTAFNVVVGLALLNMPVTEIYNYRTVEPAVLKCIENNKEYGVSI